MYLHVETLEFWVIVRGRKIGLYQSLPMQFMYQVFFVNTSLLQGIR